MDRIIPYQPLDLDTPPDLVESIRNRRGGKLINLDRMLLHSPPLARGWNAYLREVRNNLAIDANLRELAICIVAILNKAEYEFHHHAPVFKDEGGNDSQIQALREIESKPLTLSLFTQNQIDVADITKQLTRTVTVNEEAMKRLCDSIGYQQTVEIVGVISTYNMVSRFLVALQIMPEDT